MYGEKHLAATRPGQLCPSCKQPLPTTVQRYKTMGVYVPLYAEAPCTNPSCTQAAQATRRPPQPDRLREAEDQSPS
ncbi:hypothetical protein OG756_01530 [Streptomyces sp. NBC_01310]|uniref:hypothetical protein n=1 Tax=Streptomyces sp. NBC_01310 TaxID=2903820 RepID=UPI0035B5EC02|nr:hypothetical protein OG756_01530 [Streptomyces sp. NBC_01310]